MLFGHQNDDTNDSTLIAPITNGGAVNPLAVDPDTGVSLPAPVDNTTSYPSDPEEVSVLDQPPTEETTSAPTVEADVPVVAPVAASTRPTTTADTSAPTTDLLALKQQALARLTPLVNHLDQTPEEKFRTTLMLIQSADNHALLNDAYQAALAITDDKTRAQALLDVVNEINYFTQPKPEK